MPRDSMLRRRSLFSLDLRLSVRTTRTHRLELAFDLAAGFAFALLAFLALLACEVDVLAFAALPRQHVSTRLGLHEFLIAVQLHRFAATQATRGLDHRRLAAFTGTPIPAGSLAQVQRRTMHEAVSRALLKF